MTRQPKNGPVIEIHSSMNSMVLVLTFFLGFSAHAKLSSGGNPEACGNSVKVDCIKHTIQIWNEPEKTVDCGQQGSTPTTEGRVGDLHHGEVVKDGVDIVAPGMGQDGGGKVFHTWEANGKATDTPPTGADTTLGCVVIDLETLNKLKQCKGAHLEIKGNGAGGKVNTSSDVHAMPVAPQAPAARPPGTSQ